MEKMENLFDRLAAMNEGEEEIDEETRLEEDGWQDGWPRRWD